ncbi:transposase [Ferrimicrobium sp.]|uniref:transposase n=1 Tax=Ferrimicrobium sp. TaxID=2926050 RepID=UPI00344FF34C
MGLNLGVTTLARLSSGEKIDGPKAHAKLRKRLQRPNKRFSGKQKGSKNSHKAKLQPARLHAKIAAICNDSLQMIWVLDFRLFQKIYKNLRF